ncbi:MAG: TetR/AcrR family transcriptional regulator [Nitrospirota bacterium]|nr:MAG: TetR/AcrR family transcriptional regulator [Nitrospirota bacterium]
MPVKNAKEKIVQSAIRLMLDKGYAGTTVDEICENAGVSKGSFYHFFKSKEDIGVAALDGFIKRGEELMRLGHFMEVEDPIQRAFAYLDHAETVSKDLWGDGCLLGNFALDLARTHPAIRARVTALFDGTIDKLAQIFQPIADFREDGPTGIQLAEQYIAMLEGSIVLAKAHDDWKRIPRGIQAFRGYLRLLAV